MSARRQRAHRARVQFGIQMFGVRGILTAARERGRVEHDQVELLAALGQILRGFGMDQLGRTFGAIAGVESRGCAAPIRARAMKYRPRPASRARLERG